MYGYFFPYNSSPVFCKKKQLFLLHLVLLRTINLNLFHSCREQRKMKYEPIFRDWNKLMRTYMWAWSLPGCLPIKTEGEDISVQNARVQFRHGVHSRWTSAIAPRVRWEQLPLSCGRRVRAPGFFYSARSLDDIRGPNRSYAHHTWRLHGAVLASLKFPSFVAQHHSCRPLLFTDLQWRTRVYVCCYCLFRFLKYIFSMHVLRKY